MAAQLILEGLPELVVRMALLMYLAESEKEKKKLTEKLGCGTDEVEEHIDATKDVLQQLGWRPKDKGGAEVVRPEDIGQTDIFDGPSANPGARPRKTITLKCDCGAELHSVRVPSSNECPNCKATIDVEAVGKDDARVKITPAKPPVMIPCAVCVPELRFPAERKNALVSCPQCSNRYELFFDDNAELLRIVPRPLPETAG